MTLTTTREFRWDDPGAPVLNGQIGSFYGIVKTCLAGTGVAYGTGAGERHKAGWAIQWDDPGSQTIVLRNSLAHGGSGCYMRVQDDGSFTGGARVARIDVYESMSDIDTGVNLAGGGWVWKAQVADGDPRSYTLHADERTIYGTTYVGADAPPISGSGAQLSARTCTFGGGDYEASIPGNPGVFGAATDAENPGASNNQRIPSGMLINTFSSEIFATSRDLELMPSMTSARIPVLLSNGATTSGIGGSNVGLWSNPTPGTMGTHYHPALMIANGGLLGRMRGLFVPMNDHSGGGSNVGTTHAPLNTASALSLACLAGAANNASINSSAFLGRLFVERSLSWDSV